MPLASGYFHSTEKITYDLSLSAARLLYRCWSLISTLVAQLAVIDGDYGGKCLLIVDEPHADVVLRKNTKLHHHLRVSLVPSVVLYKTFHRHLLTTRPIPESP